MLKEYCDKCGAEIDASDRNDRYEMIVKLVGITKYGEDRVAKIVLCKNCFEKLNIKMAVEDKGLSNRKSEPGAVEKLAEAIRELARDGVLGELQ